MISKEKVHELCESYVCNILHGDSIFEEWLGQNQSEPAVVGLSDEQLISFARQVFSQEYQQKGLVACYQTWAKTQEFAKPEVKEVVVGLSDAQLESLHTARYKDYLSLTDFINNYRQWARGETFAQSVEVGQVWHYGATESLVVHTTDSEVAIVNTHSSKMAVLDKAEFLSKYHQHAATLRA